MDFRKKLRRLDPYWEDIAASSASLWAAIILWIKPTDLVAYHSAASGILERMTPNARTWAIVLTIAVLTKLVGLALTRCQACWGWSIVLRKFGYCVSVFWWSLLGFGALEAGFLILGFLPLLMAARMAWMTLMQQALPLEANG